MTMWKERLRASGLHLCLSAIVAGAAALLVFAVWYPYPYREISGGRELFTLIVVVDVLLGPLITLVIFNRKKPWSELRRDLALVVLLQTAALGYGLWAVAVARPVHLVFEVDRLRVVHAVDIPEELLNRTPATIEALPWTGPTLLAARPFRDKKESADATIAALGGLQIGARPDLWQTYDQARENVRRVAVPVEQLKMRFSQRAGDIDAALEKAGRNAATTAYLPLVGRKYFWTAFIDPATADVVGFLPLDPF
jgi:hypothetical protein